MRIGNDVEIGANTTIDRGAIDDTVIGDGVKMDNQIQIGHNVRIGDHTAIAGCAGISGSATIGKRCMIGGMVGVAGHLTICDDVVITGKSFVSSSIRKPGVLLERHSGRRDAAFPQECRPLPAAGRVRARSAAQRGTTTTTPTRHDDSENEE